MFKCNLQVKLSGKMEHFFMTRIDSALIAFCYGEREIRLWDLENEDSAVLPLSLDKNYDMTDRIMCLSFSQKKGCQLFAFSEEFFCFCK